MTPSPVAFNPPSVSRSEENAYRGIIPKYSESQSPMTETQEGWSDGMPLSAEKQQSAGQETDSLDTAGEAAAAAAAVLAVVVDAPVVGDERGTDMMDGFIDKGDGAVAVASGLEKETTSERGEGDVAKAARAPAEEGVPEDRLAVDVGHVADRGGDAPSIGEVYSGDFGSWKWSTPVDEEPAVDPGALEVAVAVAPTGSSAGQDGPTPRAGSSKGSVPASASSPATASDTAGGPDAAENGADNAVRGERHAE